MEPERRIEVRDVKREHVDIQAKTPFAWIRGGLWPNGGGGTGEGRYGFQKAAWGRYCAGLWD